MENKNETAIKSSAAEYLTYAASAGDNPQNIEMRYQDENVWLTQKLMAQLYNITVQGVGQHIKKVFDDSELSEEATIKNFFIVQNEGGRQVNREVEHYNLQMIIAVGFKVNNERAVQFRKWANNIVKDYTIKGWVMDIDRLKNGGSLTDRYFDEQLQKIREIRLSERKFYQKITDIYATALDYDISAAATKRFYSSVQNKLHWAIHGQTAAEVIFRRADSEKDHMGLTTWKDAPKGKIQKYDVSIAKNYLSRDEMLGLERIVSAYLDIAEDMAMRKIPMTMNDWETRLNKFIQITERDLLKDAGSISAEIAREHAETEFGKYRVKQDKLFTSDFDLLVEKTKKIKPKS